MIISPNMLKIAEQSMELFKERYIEKIPVINISKPFKQGKEIHALANFFLKGQDIKKLEISLSDTKKDLWTNLKNNKYINLDCVKSEYSISAKLDEFWIGGRIDALVKNNDDYYILDYKTGKIPDNAIYDYQTMIYLYCVDKILKNYNSLNFVYIGLKNSENKKIKFNNELKQEYEKKLLKACLKIKNFNFT